MSPMLAALKRYVPAFRWLPAYKAGYLRGDLSAGLTTAIMLIPQGMAYAMLAGLPPIVGLYASIVPLALYALFGSSRELAVGPVAMVSLLVAAGVGQLAEQGTGDYVMFAVLLAFGVGVTQLAMGVARLGFLVNFLSHPVISGFTSAAALIIGFSQLKHLLGVPLEGGHHIHAIVLQAIEQLGDVKLVTLAIGVVSLAVLVWLRRVAPMFPGALAVVVGGTLLVWGLGLHEQGVAIVGEVPAGLPAPSLPALDLDALVSLMPTVLTIALIGFMESISVAKAFARRKRYEIDANQELVGLGLANLGGSFFGAYPVTGGFSRTAVNAQAGATTPLASLVTATVVALALVLFTPLFFYLPKAVLASIIMAAVFGLVDVKEVVHLWKVKKSDLALLALTFVATLTLGIEQGILAGVGASLLWFVVRQTRPHTAVLGRISGTNAFRNVKHYPDAETFPGVLIVRIDAQFYFGNVSFLKETLKRLEAALTEPLRAVIIDASSINQLDSSADAALHELTQAYANRKVLLVFANVKGPVMEVMKRSHLCDRLGACGFHLDVERAVDFVLTELEAREAPPADDGSDEQPSATTAGRPRPTSASLLPIAGLTASH